MSCGKDFDDTCSVLKQQLDFVMTRTRGFSAKMSKADVNKQPKNIFLVRSELIETESNQKETFLSSPQIFITILYNLVPGTVR